MKENKVTVKSLLNLLMNKGLTVQLMGEFLANSFKRFLVFMTRSALQISMINAGSWWRNVTCVFTLFTM